MNLLPLRLHPGDDLRHAIGQVLQQHASGSAFLLSAIGSLVDARLRFAGQAEQTVIEGPLVILGLAGSVTLDGSHLHMSVSDPTGRVAGGHVCHGNIVRTTVEAVLVLPPEWSLTGEIDPATGFTELFIRSHPD